MEDKKPTLPKEKQELVDKVIHLMENSKKQWNANFIDFEAPYNESTKKQYKGINNITLNLESYAKNYKDPRWLTFKQAKDKGCSVRKGEKATEIYFHQLTDKKTKKAFTEESIKNLSPTEKNKYRKENVYLVTKKYHLFNGSQIDGLEKHISQDYAKNQTRNDLLDKIIAESPAKVTHHRKLEAYYIPKTDKIYLPVSDTYKNIESYYKTALHEMGHSTGHESRLDRNINNKFGTKEYAKEELVAEFTSLFTSQSTFLKADEEESHIENTAVYLKSWASLLREEPEALFVAIKEAQKAEDVILDKYREQLLEIHQEQFKEIDPKKRETEWLIKMEEEPLVCWEIPIEDILSLETSGKIVEAMLINHDLKEDGSIKSFIEDNIPEEFQDDLLEEYKNHKSFSIKKSMER